MEHFEDPFGELTLDARMLANRAFFDSTMRKLESHRFFSHPFLEIAETAELKPRHISWILSTFYHVISPFTGVLCMLAAQAPCIVTRFAVMDNIFEEMGRGKLRSAHPVMYLRMLRSLGLGNEDIESVPVLPSIQDLTDHWREVVENRPFPVACAVLAASESTIPPWFPKMAAAARRAFPGVDMDFFERHGPRDAEHSDDAAAVFAYTADESLFLLTQAEMTTNLNYMAAILDEWIEALPQAAAEAVS